MHSTRGSRHVHQEPLQLNTVILVHQTLKYWDTQCTVRSLFATVFQERNCIGQKKSSSSVTAGVWLTRIVAVS